MDVVRINNQDVGGRVIEMAETEFMVRAKGYLRGLDDIPTGGEISQWHASSGSAIWRRLNFTRMSGAGWPS